MGRLYTASFSAVGVSAAVDCFELLSASNKPIVIHEIVLGQSSDYGDAQAEGLGVILKRASGTYTTGSGGSTATPAPHLSNSAASGATCKTNNTTQASANTGALTTIRADCWNVQSGYQYLPTPETRLFLAPGEALVVSITVEADSLTSSGSVVFEELN